MNITVESIHPKYGSIHSITCEDKPWVIGRDITSALHFTDPVKAIRSCVDKRDTKTIVLDSVADLAGHNRKRVFVDLDGVDVLAAKSTYEEAEAYRMWVHSELTGGVNAGGLDVEGVDAGGPDVEAVVHDAGGNASNMAPLVFEHEEFGKFRITVINGEPWFVGKDVALVLGYANHNKALSDHVDVEDKMQGDGVTIRDPIGRDQHPVLINESGLYSLILRSKLPEAKKFKRWVTSEVLPSLRKYGMYAMPGVSTAPTIDVSELLRAVNETRAFAASIDSKLALNGNASFLQAELARTQNNLAQTYQKVNGLQNQNDSMSAYITACDEFVRLDSRIWPATAIANDYGMAACEFNELLCRMGIQYKHNSVWHPSDSISGRGYTSLQETTHTFDDGTTRTYRWMGWTTAGRLFLYCTLKQHGILPTVCKQAASPASAGAAVKQ